MEAKKRRFIRPASPIDCGKTPKSTKINIAPPIMSQPALIREMIIATGAGVGIGVGEFSSSYPVPQLPRHDSQHVVCPVVNGGLKRFREWFVKQA